MNRVELLWVIGFLCSALVAGAADVETVAAYNPWHGYVLVEHSGVLGPMNAGQEALTVEAMHSLCMPAGNNPAHTFAFRHNLANTAFILECRFSYYPTKPAFVTALAAQLGYLEGVISASVNLTVFCPAGVTDCSHAESLAEVRAYLNANRGDWERPLE
jgi:hypothetical protein